MKNQLRLLSIVTLSTILGASVLLAAAGRMKGIVADSAGNPLAGVKITMMAEGSDYKKTANTKKNGKFTLTVTDGSQAYVVRVEKEGYNTAVEPFRFEGTDVMDVAWVLYTEEEAAAQAQQIQALAAKDKATKAFNQGAEAYNGGDVDGALGHFAAAVEHNSDFDVAHAALARIYLEKEDYEAARQSTEAFLGLKPDDPVGLQMLYDAHWGAGNTEEADKQLAKLIELGSTKAVAARIFNQAVAAVQRSQQDPAKGAEHLARAERGFSKALELDGELFQARLPLAQMAFGRGDWQAALDMVEGYLAQDPSNARANIVRYESYLELGDEAAAEAAFEEIATNSPKAAAEVFLRDGTNFYNNGQVAEATAAVETSLKLDDTNPQTHYQLGLCYVSSGKSAEAKQYLTNFLEMAPEHPEAASVKDMLSYLN